MSESKIMVELSSSIGGVSDFDVIDFQKEHICVTYSLQVG
jgi:hypothetical protein